MSTANPTSSTQTGVGRDRKVPSKLAETVPMIPKAAWPWVIGLAFLFIGVHTFYLERLTRIALGSPGLPETWGSWNDWPMPVRWLLTLRYGLPNTWNPNWSHIIIVPFVSLYFLSLKREEFLATPRKLYPPGLILVLMGMVGFAAGVYPIRNDMAQGYSVILSLTGIVLFMFGPRTMRYLWFPLFYLVFGIKVSDRIWFQVAQLFQGITATGSFYTLDFISLAMDYNVDYKGTTIEVIRKGASEPDPLNVAEACSGLRSLMAFLALGTAMAFLGARPVWQRLILLASILPVTILVNIARVTIMGLLTATGNKELAHGDFHTFIGMLMLVPAGGLFWLLGWILDQIFVPIETNKGKGRGGNPVSRLKSIVEPETRVTRSDVLAGLGLGIVLSLVGFSVYLGYFYSQRPGDIAANLPGWAVVLGVLIMIGLGVLTIRVVGKRSLNASGTGRVFGMCVVMGILATSWVAQGAVLRMTKTVLIKDSVPLRHELDALPVDLGDWLFVGRQPRLDASIEEELGTTQYITVQYEDLSWPENEPGRVIVLHVPYYTGTVDTVPHVPERCFTGAGLENLGKRTVELELNTTGYQRDQRPNANPDHWLAPSQLVGEARIPSARIPATLFRFGDPNPNALTKAQNVIYFFAANGRFLAGPDQVRLGGADASDRYSYYCKIEIRIPLVDDEQLAIERVESFLSAALPEIMACLPDWEEVREGTWPPQDVPTEDTPVNPDSSEPTE